MVKLFSLGLAFAVLTSSSFALANRESGGVPPHPSLVSVVIEDPVPGIDIPTDAQFSSVEAVLVLLNPDGSHARIPIIREIPTVAQGDGYKSVLVFKRDRVQLNLSVIDDELRLNNVPVTRILAIKAAEAGIDFPTDGPPSLQRDFHILILKDGSRTAL